MVGLGGMSIEPSSNQPITYFSTQDSPADERKQQWQTHTGQNLLHLDVDSANPEGANGSLVTRHVGRLRIGLIAAEEQVASRTSDLIDRSPSGTVAVTVLLTGQAFFYHPAGYDTVNPGDLVVVDADQPAIMGFTRPSSMAVLHIPRDLQPALMQQQTATRSTMVLFDEDIHGPARTSRSLLLQRIRGSLKLVESASSQKEDGLLKLASLTVSSASDIASATDNPILLKALHLIETQAHDPNLTVELIAEAVFTSRRQLSRLFSTTGVTTREFILHARLEHAVELLDDASMYRTVAEVAALSGFSSASNLARAFRSVYGTSPRRGQGPAVSA